MQDSTLIELENLDNLHVVHDSFYRSGQPSKKDFTQLDTLGFKTIINLRKNHSDKNKTEHTSLEIIELPIKTWKMSAEDIKRGLLAIEAAQKPVLLHCWHGADRTGTITAAYRMVYQDWSKEKAISEFKQDEFGFHDKWFPNLVKLLKSLDINQLKEDLGQNN